MTADGNRWAALDSQHERLVDISAPLPVIEPDSRKLRQRRGTLAAACTELTRRSRPGRRSGQVRA